MTSIDLLSQFDPNDEEVLPDDFLVIGYGPRRSGKTTLAKYMCYQIKNRLKDHKVILISATGKINKQQYEWLPDNAESRIVDLDEMDERLGEILEDQEAQQSKNADGGGGGGSGAVGGGSSGVKSHPCCVSWTMWLRKSLFERVPIWEGLRTTVDICALAASF